MICEKGRKGATLTESQQQGGKHSQLNQADFRPYRRISRQLRCEVNWTDAGKAQPHAGTAGEKIRRPGQIVRRGVRRIGVTESLTMLKTKQ